MATVVGQEPGAPAPERLRLAPGHALLAVAVGYGLLVFLRTSPTMALTFDEVVYASQVSIDTPAAQFSAPRARGMSLLLAPVVAITEWVPAMRIYLTLLAGLLMYAAFRPWLRVFGEMGRYAYLPAVAAGWFATLWVTVLYGSLGYPNLWLAFTLVAGAGSFVRALREPGWWPVAATGIWFGAAALLRPTDALAAAGPLLLAAVLVRRWRRPLPPLAVLAGLLVGWGAWVGEAYARFGGPVQRLRDGAETNRSGLVSSLPEHLDALDGPAVLCRPHSLCEGVEPVAAVWWFALPVLVALGLAVGRGRWLAIGGLVTASAVAVALPYLMLIDYAAARFLLPSYGLLAIPVAAALLRLTELREVRVRAVACLLAVAALLAHAGVQQSVLGRIEERLLRESAGVTRVADFLREEQGVRAPCLIWGEGAIQLSYQLNCRSTWQRGEPPAEDDPDIAAALARGDTVVVRIRAELEPPDLLAGWRRVELPGNGRTVVYLPD